MKFKQLIILLLLLSPAFVNAQVALKSMGAGFSFGTSADIRGGPGVGVNGNLLISFAEILDGELMGIIYLPSQSGPEDLLFLSANSNLHFNITEMDPLIIYGLVGLNISYLHYSIDYGYYYDYYNYDPYNEDGTLNDPSVYLRPGFNIGFGFSYEITGGLDLTGQMGYTISRRHQLFLNGGLAYKF